MAEINHPSINPELQTTDGIPMAWELAEQAYEVLATYKYLYTEIVGDKQVTLPITERVEITSEDPAVITALRLKRVLAAAFNPQMELAGQGNPLPGAALNAPEDNTSNYLVIALEHGTLPPDVWDEIDEDGVTDDLFDWEPYAIAVTSTSTEEAYVLDGRTGQIFADGDILVAKAALELVQQKLRAADFEMALYEDDSHIHASVNEAPDISFTPFDEHQALEINYDHHHCIPGCALANHQESMQNYGLRRYAGAVANAAI